VCGTGLPSCFSRTEVELDRLRHVGHFPPDRTMAFPVAVSLLCAVYTKKVTKIPRWTAAMGAARRPRNRKECRHITSLHLSYVLLPRTSPAFLGPVVPLNTAVPQISQTWPWEDP
jgi:hypothetical protein